MAVVSVHSVQKHITQHSSKRTQADLWVLEYDQHMQKMLRMKPFCAHQSWLWYETNNDTSQTLWREQLGIPVFLGYFLLHWDVSESYTYLEC
jgi:hypothetical protein